MVGGKEGHGRKDDEEDGRRAKRSKRVDAARRRDLSARKKPHFVFLRHPS